MEAGEEDLLLGCFGDEDGGEEDGCADYENHPHAVTPLIGIFGDYVRAREVAWERVRTGDNRHKQRRDLPILVPKKGPRVKKRPAGPPEVSMCQTSAMVPAPIATAPEPPKPAKKRVMIKVSMFCAAPDPAVKARRKMSVIKYTGRRPTSSDIGAEMSGPSAMPRV